MSVTTSQLLASKALQETAGQQCVDWAITMLEQGYESDHLLRLAGMVPPYNHFEISYLRDRALEELNVEDVAIDVALTRFASQIVTEALNGGRTMLSAMEIIKDLCIGNDYQSNLMDFYLLYFAYTDLQQFDVQWYWPNATHNNIEEIVRERAIEFVRSDVSVN